MYIRYKTIHKNIIGIYKRKNRIEESHSKEYRHDEEILCQHQMSIYQHII